MMSYLPLSDDVNQNFYDHAKFGCNWTTNKGETGGRHNMVPKDPSLNRVKYTSEEI